jgi:hypothetical protein
MNCETIVLTTPQSSDAKAAQRWLLTAEGTLPDVHALGQTVNAYDRMTDWDKINAWLEHMINTLHSKGPTSFQNQELLDFLFLMVRKDRFIDNFVSSYEPILNLVIYELQRRVPLRSAQMAD